MEKTKKALDVAFEQHKNQKRKCDQSPYIVHILDVAKYLLSEPDASEDVVVAGILHDTLEDTAYTEKEIEKEFGSHVLNLVLFDTEPAKSSSTSKEDKRKNWKFRKEHTINACKEATQEQLLILLADKISNLQSLKENLILFGESVWSCFNATKEDTVWYNQSLRDIFNLRLNDTRLVKIYNRLVEEVFGGNK